MIRAAAAAGLAAVALIAGAPPASAAAPIAAPGIPIYMAAGLRCTLGYAASNTNGDRLAVTAGHCGTPGAAVRDRHGQIIGTYAAVQPDDIGGRRYGYAIIALRRGVTTSAAITDTVHITGTAHATAGDAVCLYGTTTGVQCGLVSSIADNVGTIDGFQSDHGDSGGPIVRSVDHALVGIVQSHDNAHTYFEPISRIRSLTAATGAGGPRFGAVVATR
jgi:hypothetical protein